MFRTARIIVFSVLCLTIASIGQVADSSDSSKLKALIQRAEQSDPHAQSELGWHYEFGSWVPKDTSEALRWYRKAAEQDDTKARFGIGRLYFEGNGGKRDYVEAARWVGCPKPSETILTSCREARYKDLPQGALDLLTKMKCSVGSNYDYGSAVDLSGNGVPAYQICCSESPHGPCASVVIGKIGDKWRDLTAKEGLLGFEGACIFFFVLESQHGGIHDVCLPDECSTVTPVKGNACPPTIWQFSNGRYRSVPNTTAKPPK